MYGQIYSQYIFTELCYKRFGLVPNQWNSILSQIFSSNIYLLHNIFNRKWSLLILCFKCPAQQIKHIFQVFIETHPDIIRFLARQVHFGICIMLKQSNIDVKLCTNLCLQVPFLCSPYLACIMSSQWEVEMNLFPTQPFLWLNALAFTHFWTPVRFLPLHNYTHHNIESEQWYKMYLGTWDFQGV